jgi:hypothetical protein
VALIQANMKLLTFLTKQSATIARLRARIVRLSTIVHDLTVRLGDPTSNIGPGDMNHQISHALRPSLRSPLRDMRHEPPPYPNPTVLGGRDSVSVLVDTKVDTSFLLKPNCDPKVDMRCLNHTKIHKQLATQLARIKENKNAKEDLWMYFDSGASRSVISTNSPIRQHLQAIELAYGSCSIGDGSPLHYLEKGHVRDNLEFTVVDGLKKFDLFSSVHAAKQGLTSIIDFDMETGENNSFTIDKTTGTVTLLVERGKGILEIPIHMMLPAKACVSVAPNTTTTQDALPPHVVSTFWHCFDDSSFDFSTRPDEVESSPLKTKIKRSECPVEPDEQLKTSYLQIIGSIIYGYTHCRLDIAFPVNMLTRIMHSPAEQHYNLLRKLLHYINGTKNWTLNCFRDYSVLYGMDFIFFCNVDAAHADDDESHRSTGGWFFFLRKGKGAVAAKSGQTKDIPLSSTESETIWGSNAAMQGAFLKQFLDETKLFKSTSFELHEDSQPMINAQKRNVSQSRFKHMKTKHHYIRKLIFDGWCKLIKIASKMNTADMATKILPASTTSVFSRVVLGLPAQLDKGTDSD